MTTKIKHNSDNSNNDTDNSNKTWSLKLLSNITL